MTLGGQLEDKILVLATCLDLLFDLEVVIKPPWAKISQG